ncbi:unnamed protein product [Tilletia controversa]|nr:hypothetical protein CF335_g1264 [Tilletia laevis]CAD6890307.1 unnamed protein product [Tilletia caries]CAD6944114.1 unnamed protein product [Tilletia controversa]CAD6942813.1 unnamed protein product [Tilletia caries]CAD6950352.1 unnamed protein product [Tilletia laevis]
MPGHSAHSGISHGTLTSTPSRSLSISSVSSATSASTPTSAARLAPGTSFAAPFPKPYPALGAASSSTIKTLPPSGSMRPPAPYRMSPASATASSSTAGTSHQHSSTHIPPPPEFQMPGELAALKGSSRKRLIDDENGIENESVDYGSLPPPQSKPRLSQVSDAPPPVPVDIKFDILNGSHSAGPSSATGHQGGHYYEDHEQSHEDHLNLLPKATSNQAGSDSQAGDGGAGSDTSVKYKKRSRAPAPGTCQACSQADTPEWRRGPGGARTLCNACGLHWAKLNRKREQSKTEDGTYLIPPITLDDLRAAPIKRSVYDEVPLHGSTTAAAAAAAAAAAVAAAASVPHPPITSAHPHAATDGIMSGLGASGLQHLGTAGLTSAPSAGLMTGYGRSGLTGASPYLSGFASSSRIGNSFAPPPPAPAPGMGMGMLSGPGGGVNSTLAGSSSVRQAGTSTSSSSSNGPVSIASPAAAAAAAAVVALHSSFTYDQPPPHDRWYNFSNDRNQPLPAPSPMISGSSSSNSRPGGTSGVRPETSSTRTTAQMIDSLSDGAGPGAGTGMGTGTGVGMGANPNANASAVDGVASPAALSDSSASSTVSTRLQAMDDAAIGAEEPVDGAGPSDALNGKGSTAAAAAAGGEGGDGTSAS